VNDADWPAAIVTGNEIPESTNSPFVGLAACTVTDAPLAVRLPVSAELEPTVTLPKLRVVGDTANVPAEVPVPDSATVSGEFVAFETTEIVPLTALALAGVKVAVNVMLCPDVRLIGNPLNPLIENPDPLTVACEIAIVDPPVFVSISDRFVLLPT
jgi:hypothetical protein